MSDTLRTLLFARQDLFLITMQRKQTDNILMAPHEPAGYKPSACLRFLLTWTDDGRFSGKDYMFLTDRHIKTGLLRPL